MPEKAPAGEQAVEKPGKEAEQRPEVHHHPGIDDLCRKVGSVDGLPRDPALILGCGKKEKRHASAQPAADGEKMHGFQDFLRRYSHFVHVFPPLFATG